MLMEVSVNGRMDEGNVFGIKEGSSLENVHENRDKRETEKQHHDDKKTVATWRRDCLLLGFKAVFEPCLGGLKK